MTSDGSATKRVLEAEIAALLDQIFVYDRKFVEESRERVARGMSEEGLQKLKELLTGVLVVQTKWLNERLAKEPDLLERLAEQARRSHAREQDARRALVIPLARLAELKFGWLVSIVPKGLLAVEDGQLDIVRSIERIRTAQATQSKPDLRRRLAWVLDHGEPMDSEYRQMKDSYDGDPQPTGDLEKAIWDLGDIMIREAEACSNRGAAVERLGVRARRNPQATRDWYARALHARHAQALLERDAVGPWEECGRAAATLANFVRRAGLIDEEREPLEMWVEATARASKIAPKRATAHYSHACACARLGNRDDALAALTRAATEGFGQPTRAAEDPDLASLHGSDEFATVLDAIRANTRK